MSFSIVQAVLCTFLFFSATTLSTNSTASDDAQRPPPLSTMASQLPYKNVAYYVNWATYSPRNFQPQNLTADLLTHLHYAFANVRSDNGTVYLSDPYSDTQKKFPTDSLNETGNNLYGCTKQLYLLKKRNRHFKTILSIGGASFTKNFASGLATEKGRIAFMSSSIALLADLGFDGLEMDWESPTDSAQAKSYVTTLEYLRYALDDYASINKFNYRFILTVAATADPKAFNIDQLAAMDKYLDYWNLMAYDYAGVFTNVTGHAANLYPSPSNMLSTPFSTLRALRTYISVGISTQKIMLGMPLYGRAFVQTAGLGKPYHGVGNGSLGQEGIWDYKALPLPGSTEVYDKEVVGSYSHGVPHGLVSRRGYHNRTTSGNETIVSYDNKETVENKVKYIVKTGLGGAMWWESSGDKMGDQSLIGTVAKALERSGGLDKSPNWLSYPTSRYDNVRNGMKGE